MCDNDVEHRHGWYSLRQSTYHGTSVYINKMGETVCVTEVTNNVDPIKLKHTCTKYVGELTDLISFWPGSYFVDKRIEEEIERLDENCAECARVII